VEAVEFKSPTRIHFGTGALSRLGDLVRESGGRRVLLVSDPGLVAAGHVAEASEIMTKAGLQVELFHDFGENPTSEMAERGMRTARQYGADFIVGLGGGSSLDCAKAINFLLTNGGCMRDYWGYGKARKPMLPMIAVPTTAGTGSEAQSYALISDDQSHRKMACGDPKATFRVAILDPQLTVSQPRTVTATAGYDALGHAVETYVSTKRSSYSQFFSLEAWQSLDKNYQRVLQQPDDLKARGSMLLGACLAGVAIENSMLGATHALANPLTDRYGTNHGTAIAILLHHVVQWNSAEVGDSYRELMSHSADACGARLEDHLQQLLEESGLPQRLRQVGVKQEDVPSLARSAMEQWTGTFNPRPLRESDALALYQAAY
jgi:alcohol dehydrogenase